jgi:TRAP-type uncharacterized transport system fused permease subunit
MLYRSPGLLGRIWDYFLMLVSAATLGYWILNFEAINYRAGAETELDQWVAVVGVLVGIEIARRVVGVAFVIIGTIMLLYGVFGDSEMIPEVLQHAGDTFPYLCTSIFYKSDGVFGIMANVLATYIILFVIFGAFLEKSGAQRFFIDFPLAAVGHKIGGPGKVSVIASGLFGSISGSATRGGRYRARRFHRRDVHAADHGRRRFHHGGDDRPALFPDHAGGDFPGADVFLQRVHDGALRSQEI